MNIEELHRFWNYDHDSGAGSGVDFCRGYVGFISEFIRLNSIRSVVDLGCGDFTVGREIDYHGARLLGVDGSLHHVNSHIEKFADRGFEFVNADVESFDPSSFDLALVKDVIQHWPLENIKRFLEMPRARFTILTNDTGGGTVNGDIPYNPMSGGRLQVAVRGLDLEAPPFNVRGAEVFRFNGKTSFLICREGEHPVLPSNK